MNCPHCNQPLSYVICSECGGETPEKGLYCCQCGKMMKRQESESEPSDRILCRDGSCIGTINEKGVCNVCGKSGSEAVV